MPHYAFLAGHAVSTPDDIVARLRTQRIVGVPYTDEMIANAKADLAAQANPAADNAALLKRYPGGHRRPRRQWSTMSPRWMRWSPICRCSAPWWTSADPANERLQPIERDCDGLAPALLDRPGCIAPLSY